MLYSYINIIYVKLYVVLHVIPTHVFKFHTVASMFRHSVLWIVINIRVRNLWRKVSCNQLNKWNGWPYHNFCMTKGFFPSFLFPQVCKGPSLWELLFTRPEDSPVQVQRSHLPKSLSAVQSIRVQQIQFSFPTLRGLQDKRQKKCKWPSHYYNPQIATAPTTALLTITCRSSIYVASVLHICY